MSSATQTVHLPDSSGEFESNVSAVLTFSDATAQEVTFPAGAADEGKALLIVRNEAPDVDIDVDLFVAYQDTHFAHVVPWFLAFFPITVPQTGGDYDDGVCGVVPGVIAARGFKITVTPSGPPAAPFNVALDLWRA